MKLPQKTFEATPAVKVFSFHQENSAALRMCPTKLQVNDNNHLCFHLWML